MSPELAVAAPAIRWASVAAAPAIALVLVASWALPLAVWAIVVVGVVSTVIFGLVVLAHRRFGRGLLARAPVLAALVMYVIALFTVVYAIVYLAQNGSIRTNGDASPGSLGVAALIATAMGIAGGEVGTEVRGSARLVAHVQLLLVIGSLAGAGAQILQRLAGAGPGGDLVPPAGPTPTNPVIELYRAVHERLTHDGGATAWRDLAFDDPDLEARAMRSIRSLPHPDSATDAEARAVFDRIISADLEVYYGLSFWGTILAEAVKPFSRF